MKTVISLLSKAALFAAIVSFLMVISHYTAKAQTTPKPAKETVIKDTVINSVSYKLYRGSRGGKFIYVTSKTGNIYKKYFKK